MSAPDFYYQLPLSLGTPARDFNLTLDMYGGDNLLFAQNFTGTTDCARKQPVRNLYSISSTAVDINAGVNVVSEHFGQPYINPKCSLPAGEDLIMGGDDLHDDLKISSTAVGKMEFNLVQSINTLNPAWKSDGIFSYYMQDLDDDGTNYMYNFRNLSTVLHLLSGAHPAAGSPTLGGHLIFGADSENSMCFDDWTTVDTDLPAFTGEYYGVNIAAVALGNAPVLNTDVLQAGLLQLSSAYITMNKQSLNYFAKTLGADYDFRHDTFTVNCGTIPSLPDIVFQIKKAAPATDPMEYRVAANVYVKKLDPASSRCTLLIRECDAHDYDCTRGKIWRLGTSFSRPYCQRIHYGYNNGLGPLLSFTKARF
ncbi:Protein ASP-7 [Aphelenchoides avenae]|nr:Protein ASP-7 [Aphelenchus avenae]